MWLLFYLVQTLFNQMFIFIKSFFHPIQITNQSPENLSTELPQICSSRFHHKVSLVFWGIMGLLTGNEILEVYNIPDIFHNKLLPSISNNAYAMM